MDKIISSIGAKFLTEAKASYIEKFTDSKDEQDKKKVERSAATIFSVAKIKKNISIIVIINNLEDPHWDGGQIKTGLLEYDFDLEVPKKVLKR